MKNDRTPRTLAEATFTTGYASADYAADAARIERRAHAAMYVLVAVFAAVSLAFYLTGA
jgi:hypothetical protein